MIANDDTITNDTFDDAEENHWEITIRYKAIIREIDGFVFIIFFHSSWDEKDVNQITVNTSPGFIELIRCWFLR